MAKQTMAFRTEYRSVIAAVEEAGFLVADMPLDSGGDRIVCAGMRRKEGGYTGNSFWLAERNGRWFLGTWGGFLYRLPEANGAVKVSLAWLQQNPTETLFDLPDELKSQFNLVPVDNEDFDGGVSQPRNQ